MQGGGVPRRSFFLFNLNPVSDLSDFTFIIESFLTQRFICFPENIQCPVQLVLHMFSDGSLFIRISTKCCYLSHSPLPIRVNRRRCEVPDRCRKLPVGSTLPGLLLAGCHGWMAVDSSPGDRCVGRPGNGGGLRRLLPPRGYGECHNRCW